jgi:hypothetical protein
LPSADKTAEGHLGSVKLSISKPLQIVSYRKRAP